MATKSEQLASQLAKAQEKHQQRVDALAARLANEKAKAIVIDTADERFLKLITEINSIAKKHDALPITVINAVSVSLFGEKSRVVVGRKPRLAKIEHGDAGTGKKK
jgi:hypothetical protein